HTRSKRDWSSDVCSSDLLIHTQGEWIAFAEEAGFRILKTEIVRKTHDFEPWLERGGEDAATMRRVRERFLAARASAVRDLAIVRSEERRVGKECGSRGGA